MYADQHRTIYGVTWWIRSELTSTIRSDLIGLGARLGWLAADMEEEDALAVVADRLRNHGDGILLVFDNALSPASLRAFLPTASLTHVLITSNNHAWRSVAETIEVGTWPIDTGKEYLVQRTGRDNELAEAEVLSGALDGLPLAHEQAAAYCEQLDVSLGEYCKRFDAAPLALLRDENYAAGGYQDGRTTVARTFSLAIEAAARLHPAAEPLIVHASLLAAVPIPLFFFADSLQRFADVCPDLRSFEDLERALAALRALALINRETTLAQTELSPRTETIRLHSLVRLIAASRPSAMAREAVKRRLIRAMSDVYPADVDSVPQNWPRARQLDALTFELVAGRGSTVPGTEDRASYLLNQLATYRAKATFAYQEAETLYRKALAINEEFFAPNHIRVGNVLNNLASLVQTTKNSAEAEPLYRRALAINEAWHGPEHPNVSTILNNLASCLDRVDRFAEAEGLYRRALEIDEAALGETHRVVARDLNNIAELLRITNRLTEAEQLYRRALAINESSVPERDVELATSLSNLATLLSDVGRFSEARPLYERALTVAQRAVGPEHPDVATILELFGNCLRDTSHLPEAETHLRRALAIREFAFAPDHAEVAMSLNDIGETLRLAGRTDEAELCFRRALSTYEKSLGKTHHRTASVMNNLGNLLSETSRFDEARPLYEGALEIDEAIFGPNHPRISTDLNNIATLFRDINRLDEAEPLYRRALAIDEVSLGPEHYEVANDLNNLALLLKDTNRLKEAEPLFRRALAIYEQSLGSDHALVAGLLFNLATLLRVTGRAREAVEMLERAAEIIFVQISKTGSVHPHIHLVLAAYRDILVLDYGQSDFDAHAKLAALGEKHGFSIDRLDLPPHSKHASQA